MKEQLQDDGVRAKRARPAAEVMVAKYDARQVSDHPFFLHLQSQPVDLSAIWLLMANLHGGISDHFVQWLAATIEKVDERRIASLIAKQLNDELGNGDFQQIHSLMLDQFVAGLVPWRPKGIGAEVLEPGQQLLDAMAKLFASDAYEGVGTLMASEIFASKMDTCLGNEIRRQSDIPRPVLRWLEVHETLELDHANDSLLLAALIPNDGPRLEAVRRGAAASWDALWGFLDGVHDVNTSQMASARRDSRHAPAR
jgi:pyrroloquinoline quinone (PQQ) biosynthesis protein C